MKIKNIKFNSEKVKELAPYLIMGSLILGSGVGFGVYYLPDNFKDNIDCVNHSEINTDNLETFNGELYYVFNAREHKVKMSQNDTFFRKIEAVPGYEITEVLVNGWRDNSQVVFVNKVPVRVKVTSNENGNLEFNDFGVVIEEEKVKSK